MEQDAIVRIRNLNKTFTGRAGKVTALDGIDLDINRGEIFGIIGLSGAGKSTLVRCINFLETPTAGTVTVDGQELGKLSKKQLLEARRSMGMIFQQFNLLQQRTALQNICFPLEIAGVSRADAVKRATELLEIVGLSDRADNYPSQLSGGQQQRVAIARALATNPKILLCDEATSALDPTTTRSILALLKEINKTLGITIIVITHEMAVIEEICQRVAIIDSSHIAEVGTVDEVFTRPQSAMAKQLIYPDGKRNALATGKRYCRIVFDADYFQHGARMQVPGQHPVRGHQEYGRPRLRSDDPTASRGRTRRETCARVPRNPEHPRRGGKRICSRLTYGHRACGRPFTWFSSPPRFLMSSACRSV